MRTLKKIGFWIVSYTIRLVLFGCVTASVLVVVAGKPEDVKAILNQANSYERFVPAVIDANKNQSNGDNTLDYSDPKVVSVITNSFPAADLRTNAENVIDHVYGWLDGSVPQLSFTVDFTQNKIALADGLTSYAFTRLAFLPPCKSLPSEVNPLTIQCQPPDYDDPAIQTSYRDQLLDSESFLSKTVITEKDLPKNTQGKTFAQQYSFAPTAYKWLLRAPYVLGALTVIMSVLYIFLSPKKRRGVSGLGSVFMGSGITLAIFPILYDFILPKLTSSFQVQSGTTGTQAIFSDVISQVTSHVDSLFITIGIQLTIVGLSIYLLERATRDSLARYKDVSKKAGVATSLEKPEPSPRSLRGKLTVDNIPLQSSDLPAKRDPKKVAENNRYRALYSSKRRPKGKK